MARAEELPDNALSYFVGGPGRRLTPAVARAVASVLGLDPDERVVLAGYGLPRQGSVRSQAQALLDGCPVCACPDCGESGQRCLTPGAKYLAGHHLRDPEWKARHAGHGGWRRLGETEICALDECHIEGYVARSQRGEDWFCCKAILLANWWRPTTGALAGGRTAPGMWLLGARRPASR